MEREVSVVEFDGSGRSLLMAVTDKYTGPHNPENAHLEQ